MNDGELKNVQCGTCKMFPHQPKTDGEVMVNYSCGGWKGDGEVMVKSDGEKETQDGGKNTQIEEKKVDLDADSKGGKGGGVPIRWQPGQSGNPLGRARRADERAIIAAMDKALPPDKLAEALQDAMAWAYEYKSPKLILAIAQFVVSYQIGQPVQRSVSASGKLENILSRLSSMDDGEFEQVEAAMRGEITIDKG